MFLISHVQITQKTPLRVLHRRSALTRTRHIYSMSAAMLNDHYFVLNVITSAGAYVKEFVHGDLGRTFPSISSVISSPVSQALKNLLAAINGSPKFNYDMCVVLAD